MGKNLKGREIGKGITQRKDKKYEARFTTICGERIGRRFDTLSEAKNWLLTAKDDNLNGRLKSTLTLNEWFKIWIELKAGALAAGTIESYEGIYKNHYKKAIGHLEMKDIKAYHIQSILNSKTDLYTRDTIQRFFVCISSIMRTAVKNEVIPYNPVSGKIDIPKRCKPSSKEIKVLTLKQQEDFLAAINGQKYELIYRLALQTGMRAGELGGLRWKDIDFNKKILHVRQQVTLVKDRSTGQYSAVMSMPKSETGIRKIPLTEEALRILRIQQSNPPEVVQLQYKDLVFCTRSGTPVLDARLNAALRTIEKKNDSEHVTMHMLRHTFATRCIEAGMKPKTLQSILGHATLDLTMNLYVHTTEDEKISEVEKASEYLKNLA